MDETKVIKTIRAHLQSLFPKQCNCCNKTFATFAEFVKNTEHVGKPVSYDAEMGMFAPSNPIGALGMSNCSCGSTLALSSQGLHLTTHWQLLRWGQQETTKRGCSISDILVDLRHKIDEHELGGTPKAKPSSD